MTPSLVKIRSFVAVSANEPGADVRGPAVPRGDMPGDWISTSCGGVRIWFRPRTSNGTAPPSGSFRLLLGDDAEVRGTPADASAVNASTISIDALTSTMTVLTSIVGLPPVFLYQDAQRTVLSSDLHLIASLPGVGFELDPSGVIELGRIGRPVQHRTLFKRTTLIASGARVTLRAQANLQIERAWQLPEAAPASWEEFLDLQSRAFCDAVGRLDVSESILSLTAGLDTRTILAVLAKQGRLPAGVTMSGDRLSLDARTAARLCRAYGVPHRLVVVGEQFVRDLPSHVERASLLSGGLASLRQAPEVFLYDQLGGEFSARLSGNLGNQVGRGGTEGFSTRGAGLDILAPSLRAGAGETQGHWLLDELKAGGTSAVSFILQHEVPVTLVGNFTLGSNFAVQQSPYADRALVETLARRPSGGSAPSGSLIRMRARDLKHRFIGEPASTSFQRSLLARLDGFAATYPINFGWRAAGGVSPIGLMRGVATMAGIVAQKRRLDEAPLGGVLRRTGLMDLHDFHRSAQWLKAHLRDFTRDVVGTRAIREAGFFDQPVLTKTLDEHFEGTRDHHETVMFALDVALAHRLFCVA